MSPAQHRAYDALEETQDFHNPLGAGVWRRVDQDDPDRFEANDGEFQVFQRAPELSERYPIARTNLLRRQAE